MGKNFNPEKLTYGFIGLGLIGGSIAKALRKKYNECTIVAYNRSEKPRRMALEDGTASIVTDSIDGNFKNCDFVFLCTPVEYNEIYLEKLLKVIKTDCIITDVGSVKSNIHQAAKKLGIEKIFIGGHPMAGSEKSGYEFSDAEICEGAVYPITPTDQNSSEDIENYESLVASIGFRPVIMNYSTHDFVTATISHVPHLVAAELAVLASEYEDDNKYMQLLAANGFKDTTRIAASSADVWKQICITNSENISNVLGKYIENLQCLKKAIEAKDEDYIFNLFSKSKKYRDEF